MHDEQNPRKARRDKRRVPKIRKQDIPPLAELPESDVHWWRNQGRKRQIGRELCIDEGKHQFVRSAPLRITYLGRERAYYTIWCGRCGEYAVSVKQ